MYRAELDKATNMRGLLEGAQLSGAPWGCDASLYSAHRYAGNGFLLVGDAASFIDPLSSFGVKKALASAWLAAIVVNTSLGNPAMGAVASEFFDRFYHNWLGENQSKAVAFQNTVKDLQDSSGLDNKHQCSAFSLSGDWR